jgi:hypothetical protein
MVMRILCGAVVCAMVVQAQVGVYTSEYDLNRTNANQRELVLNTSNVNATSFGKLFSRAVD